MAPKKRKSWLRRHRDRAIGRLDGIADPEETPLEVGGWQDADLADLDDDLDDEDFDEDLDGPDLDLERPPWATSAKPPVLTWKQHLDSVKGDMQREGILAPAPWPPGREITYVVDVAGSMAGHGLLLEVGLRQPLKGGGWRHLTSVKIPPGQVERLPDPADRQILALLAGAGDPYGYESSGVYGYQAPFPHQYRLGGALLAALLPQVCLTGRCSLRAAHRGLAPPALDSPALRWDDGAPWELWLEVRRDEGAARYVLAGSLRREGERVPLSAPELLVAGGFVFFADRVARLDDGGTFSWIRHLRAFGSPAVPIDEAGALIGEIVASPRLPRLDLPAELRYEEVVVAPRCRLRVMRAPREWAPSYLRGELSFEYDGVIVPAEQPGPAVLEASRRRLIVRDLAAERGAQARLRQLRFRPRTWYARHGATDAPALAARYLPRVVSTLLGEGWHVEADGKLYRQPGGFRLEVTSGIDWFELHGVVEFGETMARLPELLAALRRGENAVRLGDGTFGILPEEWLRKYGLLAGLGTPHDDHLRFTRSQVGLLDALLAAQPAASCDAVFERARQELSRFRGVEPADPPPGFLGQLRGYQREGLGWLHFLRRFGFGGCLADDMGLGKTVMVLALLESRRAGSNGSRPSLVVVPRSLVFNWKQEAARFTPGLRVLDYTGADRGRASDGFDGCDLVLTTYGTLRRDAAQLKDTEFEYVILDEAQTIKNASTESAKAARLLRSAHRLALSGTPIENHLGELWSLFEFLNPGMLGAASALRLDAPAAQRPDGETRGLLARALRPFILRRTKAQVATELPARLEQTLYCELEAAQRTLYEELRDHYRRSLSGRIEREGFNRSKILVLEALLRLRQAACHPGLLDRGRIAEPSAKLDVLLPRLAEVMAEGHKVLVFSQFTSLLSIVRERLDRERVRYEYLDGHTRDRAARVAHFQDDPDCKLFLVSLRAGGLGLNLTAAEYVFLLDPWWNPAVEAQAIDRAHRIGQTRPVFAYRLIARDTVEEKILALQATKRDLAEAILTEDNSLIRTLSREDLELLLS